MSLFLENRIVRLLDLGALVMLLATVFALAVNWAGSPSLIRGAGEILLPALSALVIGYFAREALEDFEYFRTLVWVIIGIMLAVGGAAMMVWRSADLNRNLATARELHVDVNYWAHMAWQAQDASVYAVVATVLMTIAFLVTAPLSINQVGRIRATNAH